MSWIDRLTPFDYETIRMVESLTERECTLIKNSGEDLYNFEADYSQHDKQNYITAIKESIEGRLGERVKQIVDIPQEKKLLVEVYFSEEKLPEYYRYPKTEPNIHFGHKYTKEFVYALQFIGTLECANQMALFVGNGEVELPDDGPAKFSFIDNISGLQREVPEGHVVIYRENCPYLIVSQDEFERDYI